MKKKKRIHFTEQLKKFPYLKSVQRGINYMSNMTSNSQY